MTENRVRTVLSFLLILSHFGLIILCVGFFVIGGFGFEQMTTILAVIVPMFAGYTTSFIKHIVANRTARQDTSEIVTSSYTFFSLMLPTLFVGLLCGAIIAQAYSKVFANFEQFKQALIVIEGVFAIYIGYFVYSLVDKQPPTTDAPVQPQPQARQPRT